MSKLSDICPDFHEWPDRWKVSETDLDYGKQLLAEFRPFAESLAESSFTSKTIKRHLTNLWHLGGEIIRDVSSYNDHMIPAHEKIMQSIDSEGGPLCRHLNGEAEMKSYDSTCKKLYNFMKVNT